MRNVISAIEIVIDKDFPVAVYVIGAAIEKMELADAERRDALYQSAKEFMERLSMSVEVHKNEALPCLYANGKQAVLRTIEILYSFELGHPFERAIEAVLPAVVRTLQDLGMTAGLRDDRGRMMAANVEKSSHDAIGTAHDDNGLSGESSGNEVSRILQLAGASDQLPGLAEQ